MKNDNGAVLIRTTPNTNQVRLSTSLPAGRLDITRLTNRRELEQVIEYRLAEMMGMAGFSYKAIGKALSLKKWEVKYRLMRVGIKVRAYRDGESPLAREVIARLDEVAQRKLVENLEGYLLK